MFVLISTLPQVFNSNENYCSFVVNNISIFYQKIKNKSAVAPDYQGGSFVTLYIVLLLTVVTKIGDWK